MLMEVIRWLLIVVGCALVVVEAFDLIFKKWFERKLEYKSALTEAVIDTLGNMIKKYGKGKNDGQDQSLSGVRTGEEGRDESGENSGTV